MPTDMRILLVQQQVVGSDTDTPLQVLLQADTERTRLLQEQQRLEKILDGEAAGASSSSSSNDSERNKDDCETDALLAEAAERWSDIAVELEVIEADKAEERGLEILRGLQFTPEMLAAPTSRLSGGWRMRLALAKSLFVPGVDLLLYDECTNHLDLAGLDWLINHLNNNNNNNSNNNNNNKSRNISDKKNTSSSTRRNEDRTLIVVSHDRTFLNAVCTDIMHMEHQQLTYHPGNYADYERTLEEKAARETQILDASARQRSKAQAFVQKQQQQANKKSADPNKQRQAKMIREKKMDRIGNYRQDGKRYKQFSLAKLNEDSIRLAEKVEVKAQEAVVQMQFPNPSWPPGIGPNEDIVRMENLSFGFIDENGVSRPLLKNVTASLHRGSKVAVVGSNGAGKTSLMKLIAGELVLSKNPTRNDVAMTTPATIVASHGGEFWRHANIRVGHVTQYSVEELERDHASKTVVEYAEEMLKSGKASASIVAKHAGNVRQYLGAFGLGGRHALQSISKLSGGERMRLCFATVLAEEPHLLAMDESTNHVDIETLDSMSRALHAYEGSVLMVSHNQGFLSGFCTELWVIEDGGRLTLSHSDTDSFDEIFSQYRTAAAAAVGQSLSDKRGQKANLAKKASMQQRSGARTNTALL
jgi:ATPase subunit of ABC transporter with duplicated ATPase domains